MINRGLWTRLDTWSAAELFDLPGFSGPVGGELQEGATPRALTASQGRPREGRLRPGAGPEAIRREAWGHAPL